MQPINYPYYQVPAYQQQVRTNYQDSYAFLKGRPVASLDEARASMIDFDGSTFYFPDTANKRIYTKSFNVDGSSSFKTYELIDTPSPATQEPAQTPDSVTRAEFEEAINGLLLKIDSLHAPVEEQSKPKATPKAQPAEPVKQAFKF